MKHVSKNQELNTKKNWLIISAVIILTISIGYNVYLSLRLRNSKIVAKPSSYVVVDSDQKIKDIEAYLDSISSSYMTDEQALSKQYNIPSWGCGPSSYAMAKILDQKFFNNQLVIGASYNNRNPYEIIERFGLADDKGNVIDHAWVEIYFQNKFLFIDPSVGQFGVINKVAYQVFTVGQSDFQDILKSQYGIYDMRLSLLMQKVADRVPIDQSPYPGMTIKSDSINYFMQVLDDRNDVNDGVEPDAWQYWVSYLINKYLN